MPILTTDIKLLQSERMVDTPDGGGRRTSNVIPDGVAGNIFPKVSRLDSVYGRVNLRKVFAHVDTPNADTYAGAHAALLDAADNEKIVVNLFTTNSEFDTRTQARDRIESYVVAGPESRLTMYGRQLAGQGAFVVYQRVEESLPEVGSVFCLSNEDGGTTQYQQFVRVEDVSHEVRTFTDASGEFERRVVTLKIGSTLRYEFVGVEVPSRSTTRWGKALVRSTTVADASRYFGIRPLTGGVLAEALSARVDTIFSPIVPTSTREAAIANAQIAGAAAFEPAAKTALSFRHVGNTAPGSGSMVTLDINFTLGVGVQPGSFTCYIAPSDQSYKSENAVDDGKGNVGLGVKPPNYTAQVNGGTIEYATGKGSVSVTWANGLFEGRLYVAFIPAVEAAQPAHTVELPVTIQTRGTVQVLTLNPLPAKGSTIVDFRALGKWYRLRDDGTGSVAGDDPAYGTGTVDPTTGSLVVTLGALPDVGSSVIVSWASPVHYTILAGATADADAKAVQVIRLPKTSAALPFAANSMSVQYVSGGVTYTASGNSQGQLSGGDVTGTINAFEGVVTIGYTKRLPDAGSVVTVGYEKSDPADAAAAPLVKSGFFNVVGTPKGFTVPTPINSLRITVPVHAPAFAGFAPLSISVDAAPDAQGKLITLAGIRTFTSLTSPGYPSPVWSVPGGDEIGVVDLDTGDVSLYSGQTVTLTRAYFRYWDGGWSPAQHYGVAIDDGQVSFFVGLANATSGTTVVGESYTLDDAPLQIDLTKNTLAQIVPGSVTFDAYGKSYFDRNGIVYHTMQPDGTGTVAGTIDYAGGIVTLTDYNTNAVAANVAITSCLTKYGQFTATHATFRTAGSPLRPGSAFVQVVDVNGDTLTATCDQDGTLSGTYARGNVNQQMGIVSIEWGEMVTAAGNETQPWYDEANVDGDQVWKPREIIPTTIRYNAVVETSLPLDADKIGLDPVRLPSDGRVPIFRAGDVVLIQNTKSTALPDPLVAGATYDLGRTDVADVTIIDSTGARLPTSEYVVDYAAGTVTMAADLSIGSLVGPFTAKHRIEELNLLSDVQINGELTLSSALSRDFDAGSFVSGALLFGDLFARVSNVFDQTSWTGVWSDSRIGSNGAAEYNTLDFPIEVQNDGAVTERWRINFTSNTGFQVLGENIGLVAVGVTTADCSPVNQLTGLPYFTLRAGGWGAGWAVGQQLRFNTYGAVAPIWMARTVLPGASLSGDSIDMQVRGDVDA